jgi:hypothetical protein
MHTRGTYGRGEDDRVFTRAQMFWVAPLIHFLEAAPTTITSQEYGEMRRELQPVECGRPRAR